jgi:tetratricopeptide (TPR) repeat protein
MDAYKQAIRIKADYAEAHYNLGNVYIDSGKYQEAIGAFKQAIRIKPDYAEAHYNLGGAYIFMNDKDSAVEVYNILKDLDEELANKLFNAMYP